MRTIKRRTAGVGAAVLTAAALTTGTTMTTAAPAVGASAHGFDRLASTNGDIARAALRAVSNHKAAVHAGAAHAFTVRNVLVDPDGTSHVRMTRTFHALPVIGGDLVVHQSKAGAWQGRSDTPTPAPPPS